MNTSSKKFTTNEKFKINRNFSEQINEIQCRFNKQIVRKSTHYPQKFLPKNNIFRLNLNLKSIENF